MEYSDVIHPVKGITGEKKKIYLCFVYCWHLSWVMANCLMFSRSLFYHISLVWLIRIRWRPGSGISEEIPGYWVMSVTLPPPQTSSKKKIQLEKNNIKGFYLPFIMWRLAISQTSQLELIKAITLVRFHIQPFNWSLYMLLFIHLNL